MSDLNEWQLKVTESILREEYTTQISTWLNDIGESEYVVRIDTDVPKGQVGMLHVAARTAYLCFHDEHDRQQILGDGRAVVTRLTTVNVKF